MTNTKTLDYYNENASRFSENTLSVDFTATQDKFLSYIPDGGSILDFGCGSGRDTVYFLEKGYRVEATDGSEQLAMLASTNTGITVKQMLFDELDECGKYDGIWACASILHLSKSELKPVFCRMLKALKPGGTIYTSFKYSLFEGERNGRYFTDFTWESFESYTCDIAGMTISEHWITGDVRQGRGEEKWLNLILRKTDTI